MEEKWNIVNVEAIVCCQDKCLMIKRSDKEEYAQGVIALVGGKVENVDVAEDILEESLRREIREEVGIEVDNIRYLCSSSFITDKGEPVVDIVFWCKYKSGTPCCNSEDEVAEVFWVKLEDILNDEKLPKWYKKSFKIAENLMGY